MSIKQNDSYDKEEIMMYKYIANMILQRAEKIKSLAGKLKENEAK